MTRSLALLAVLAVGSIASADVVGPPPASCPAGSTPSSSHSGPLCRPAPECTATSCASPARCMAVFQCIEERPCGGLLPPDSGPCTIDHVVGPCDSGGACSTGTCRARSVCSTAPTTGSGCSCRVGRTEASAGLGLGLLALALTLLLRPGLAQARRR